MRRCTCQSIIHSKVYYPINDYRVFKIIEMTEKTESTDSTDSNDSTDDIALVKPTVISNKDVKHALKLNIVFGLHMGSGTYANVFKARYESKMVAMKVTDYASSCKRLAKQELSVLQILKVILFPISTLINPICLLKDKPHKYIVKFIEYFYNRDKTYVWFLLEWFNGMDMADKLDYNKGPFSEKVAKHYFIQIVDAIKFLHTQNIVHRDIKMDNVLVGPIDQSKNVTDVDHLSECVKIIDFGFAKIVEINEDDRAMCSSKIGMSSALRD